MAFRVDGVVDTGYTTTQTFGWGADGDSWAVGILVKFGEIGSDERWIISNQTGGSAFRFIARLGKSGSLELNGDSWSGINTLSGTYQENKWYNIWFINDGSVLWTYSWDLDGNQIDNEGWYSFSSGSRSDGTTRLFDRDGSYDSFYGSGAHVICLNTTISEALAKSYGLNPYRFYLAQKENVSFYIPLSEDNPNPSTTVFDIHSTATWTLNGAGNVTSTSNPSVMAFYDPVISISQDASVEDVTVELEALSVDLAGEDIQVANDVETNLNSTTINLITPDENVSKDVEGFLGVETVQLANQTVNAYLDVEAFLDVEEILISLPDSDVSTDTESFLDVEVVQVASEDVTVSTDVETTIDVVSVGVTTPDISVDSYVEVELDSVSLTTSADNITVEIDVVKELEGSATSVATYPLVVEIDVNVKPDVETVSVILPDIDVTVEQAGDVYNNLETVDVSVGTQESAVDTDIEIILDNTQITSDGSVSATTDLLINLDYHQITSSYPNISVRVDSGVESVSELTGEFVYISYLDGEMVIQSSLEGRMDNISSLEGSLDG
jgi:hypothetical protein